MKAIALLTKLLHYRRDQLRQDLMRYSQDRQAALLPEKTADVATMGELTAAANYHQYLTHLASVAEQHINETQAALEATVRETQELTRLSERQQQREAVEEARRDERRLWDEMIRPHMIKEHSS